VSAHALIKYSLRIHRRVAVESGEALRMNWDCFHFAPKTAIGVMLDEFKEKNSLAWYPYCLSQYWREVGAERGGACRLRLFERGYCTIVREGMYGICPIATLPEQIPTYLRKAPLLWSQPHQRWRLETRDAHSRILCLEGIDLTSFGSSAVSRPASSSLVVCSLDWEFATQPEFDPVENVFILYGLHERRALVVAGSIHAL
jgi:hypothetical protein